MDGALPPVIFEAKPPPSELSVANIRHALTLGLPDAHGHLPKYDRVTIVANGPSARDFLAEPDVGIRCAVNGSIKLFREAARAPEYWIVCDPQELVLDFLDGPLPETTTYLVASKCHASVFERLRDRKVLLWHSPSADEMDALPRPCCVVFGGVSVTLRALNLFRGMCGTKSFDVWGWDCAFSADGAHHAVAQPHQAASTYVTVEDETGPVIFKDREGTWFHTTVSWAYETESAVEQLRSADYKVRIYGPGLMAAVMRCRKVEATL